MTMKLRLPILLAALLAGPALAQTPVSGLPAPAANATGYASVCVVPGTAGTKLCAPANVGALATGTTTSGIPEGSNLYFTTGRASAAAPVQSVNGGGGAVTITPANIGAVATSAVGAANGVTPLGSDSKVPAIYLPAASGGTSLATTPPNSLGTTSSTGTSTSAMRADATIAHGDLSGAGSSIMHTIAQLTGFSTPGYAIATGTAAQGRSALGSGAFGDSLFLTATNTAAKSLLAITAADVSGVATLAGPNPFTGANTYSGLQTFGGTGAVLPKIGTGSGANFSLESQQTAATGYPVRGYIFTDSGATGTALGGVIGTFQATNGSPASIFSMQLGIGADGSCTNSLRFQADGSDTLCLGASLTTRIANVRRWLLSTSNFILYANDGTTLTTNINTNTGAASFSGGVQVSSTSNFLTNVVTNGTWTATPVGSTTAGTFGTTALSVLYDQFQKRVFGSINLTFGNSGTAAGAVGDLRIPMPVGSGAYPTAFPITISNVTLPTVTPSGVIGLACYLPANAGYCVVEYVRNGGALSPVPTTDVAAGWNFSFSFNYTGV